MNSNDDPDPTNIVGQLVIIVVLTLVNAFLAASEMAVVSANKVKINVLAEKGNKKAIRVLKLYNNETKFLSTIQVGITLAGFFSSATAAVSLSDDLGRWLVNMGVSIGNELAFIGITLILSFFTLIFGELYPKRIALAFPEKVSMFVSGPIMILKVLFSPFVKLLSGTCNILVKITRLDKVKRDDKISEDEIKNVIETGVSDGTIDIQKQKMIESVLKFNNLTATDVMTPRVQTYMINIDGDIVDNLNNVLKEKYTRIPVYEKTQDNIIGILNIKDLFNILSTNNINDYSKKKLNIRPLLRKPLFVIEKLKINKVFQLMKDSRNQMSILLDEFGGFSGIVTMEDIIEEVMGSINDEYDDENNLEKINDNEYIVDGNIPIQEINRELGLELDENNGDYDSLGGLVISYINRFPKVKEEIIYNDIKLIIEKIENKIIKKIRIIKLVDENKESEETDE